MRKGSRKRKQKNHLPLPVTIKDSFEDKIKQEECPVQLPHFMRNPECKSEIFREYEQRNIQEPKKLSSCTLELLSEKLWKNFPEEKRNSFAYLDCLWYSLYTKYSCKQQVLSWIKKKNIFCKKYVFVPIIQWCHWSLLIFCNFDDDVESKTSSPCMLLLDSMQMIGPKRLEPGIRKFVLDIFKLEERSEDKKLIYKIPLRIPKVPQQRNGEDCGVCVLYYMNLFMETAPQSFSLSKGYPYFMKKDWFTDDDLESFRERLDSYIE